MTDSSIAQTFTANDKFDVQSINHLIEQYKEYLEQTSTAKDLRSTILDHFIDFSNAFITLGSLEFRKSDEIGKTGEFGAYLLHYGLSEPFKDFLFLNRDVLLQLSIAHHKYVESRVDVDVIKIHFTESKEVLLKALDYFGQKSFLEQKRAERLNKTKDGLASQLKHQQNPWNIYQDQFSGVQEQMIQIDTAGKAYQEKITIFESIRNYTHDITTMILKEGEDMVLSVKTGIETMEEISEVTQIESLVASLHNMFSKINFENQLQENFSAFLASKTGVLGQITLPIATSGGLLLTKKMDLGKAAQKWLDYAPLPYFIDLWENRIKVISYYQHALLNLENALTLLKKSSSLETLPTQLGGFRNLDNSLKEYVEKQEKVVAKIQKIMNTKFLATSIYQDRGFLEVSLQSSLTHLTSQRTSRIGELSKRLKKLFNRVGSKYEQSVMSNPGQKLEQAMRCINYRMYKEENAHYDTLFLNKNFVGDLFLVNREEAETKLSKAVTLWNSGMHKSVLVIGNPLSGKSTFMEKMAKEHFGRHILMLKVDSDFVVEGRKFKTTKNLGEALKQVKKSIYNTRPVIIIDDLEVWRNKEHSLLENVVAVINFIESESDDVFIMVSTSAMMMKHLDSRLPFSNIFSTLIDIEKADFKTIYKALLMRNGASHRILVDEKEALLTDKELERHIHKLCREFNYNLGEVLQAWTYGTTMTADNKVIYKDRNITFEDFFTPSEILILKYLVHYTYVNEVILKDFLAKRYDQTYRSGLRRLSNTKVLVRDENSYLRINGVLNHDIRELLKYRGILK